MDPGLCATCRHSSRAGNRRGSTFWLCRYAQIDPRYPKYPPLPVRACPVYSAEETRSEGRETGGES